MRPTTDAPSPTAAPGPTSPQRLAFIDGLRGVAAAWVMFYHVWENLAPSVAAWFPTALGLVFGKGNLGVEIFFVLSGFVIAHSVRNGLHTWGYLGRFAVRRSIRLDPALWLTIALELVALLLTIRLFPSYRPEVPDWATVAANATYLQTLLGFPHIVPVFWTLTYEVQFYFFLVLVLVVARSWGLRGPTGTGAVRPGLTAALLLASCVASLALYVGLVPTPIRGLFIDRWYQFAVGIAVWLWARGRISGATLTPFFVALLVALPLAPDSLRFNGIVAIGVTGLVLVGATRAGRLEDGLSGPGWQFMGRISYSLYLIHLTVGWRFVTLARELIGPEFGVLAGSGVLLGAVAVSVGSAWLMYRLVEAPTMHLARRVALPTAPREAPPAREPEPGREDALRQISQVMS